MIERIESQVLWNGRVSGPTWFHPRACMAPGHPYPIAVMTMQAVTGSDVFHQLHWTESADLGKTWSAPAPIASTEWRHQPDGIDMGCCDFVPEYHPPTGTVLTMGHNVYYKDATLTRPSEQRYAVYLVRRPDGGWTDVRKLAWQDPRAAAMYACGCQSRVTLDDGSILVALSFAPTGRKDRAVGSVRSVFDGNDLRIAESGNALHLAVKRGLLEPGLVQFGDRFYMTIRAEDGYGYVAVSDDGLQWGPIQPWCWDDGEPLTMSTTQQHWLPHSDALFLVYTRKAEENRDVFRWRAPLYVAQVEVATMRLIRETEKTVLPLIGDGINDPEHVARLGNFHVTNASPDESWVTVGETLPADDWKGDVLLGRIRWAVPNRRAVG